MCLNGVLRAMYGTADGESRTVRQCFRTRSWGLIVDTETQKDYATWFGMS